MKGVELFVLAHDPRRTRWSSSAPLVKAILAPSPRSSRCSARRNRRRRFRTAAAAGNDGMLPATSPPALADESATGRMMDIRTRQWKVAGQVDRADRQHGQGEHRRHVTILRQWIHEGS